jgi:hypothetical protein
VHSVGYFYYIRVMITVIRYKSKQIHSIYVVYMYVYVIVYIKCFVYNILLKLQDMIQIHRMWLYIVPFL